MVDVTDDEVLSATRRIRQQFVIGETVLDVFGVILCCVVLHLQYLFSCLVLIEINYYCYDCRDDRCIES